MEVAAQPPALLLACGDDRAARVLELRGQRDRVERERELAREQLDEHDVAGPVSLARRPRPDDEPAQLDWPRWRSTRISAGSCSAPPTVDGRQPQPRVGHRAARPMRRASPPPRARVRAAPRPVGGRVELRAQPRTASPGSRWPYSARSDPAAHPDSAPGPRAAATARPPPRAAGRGRRRRPRRPRTRSAKQREADRARGPRR